MAALLPSGQKRKKIQTSEKPDFHIARSCYGHLAGEISIKIVESLISKEILFIGKKEFEVTDKGSEWFNKIGINTNQLKTSRRSFAKKMP